MCENAQGVGIQAWESHRSKEDGAIKIGPRATP